MPIRYLDEEKKPTIRYLDEPPAPSWGDYAIDAARGAPGYLARGANAILGAPGDVRELAKSGATYLGGEGAGEMAGRALGAVVPFSGPTSDQLNSVSADHLPKSQHAPGQWLGAGLEMVPPAVMAGPGGLTKKVASGLATGIGSEAAGKAAGAIDPSYETPAKIASSVGLGLATAPRSTRWTGGTTAQEVGDAVEGAYSQLNGVQASPATIARAKAAATAALAKEGYNPRYHHQITGWLKQIDDLLPRTKTNPESAMTGIGPVTTTPKVTFDDFKNLRGHSLDAAFKGTPDDRRLAMVAKESLDEVVESAPEFKGLPAEAKKAYFQKKRLEYLDGFQKLVGMRNSYANTDDFAKALKAELRPINRAMIKQTYSGRMLAAQFSKEQRKLIDDIVNGELTGTAAKHLKNYSASNPIAGPTNTNIGIIGSLLYGDPTPLAVTVGSQAVGSGAKAYTNAKHRNAMEELIALATGAQRVPRSERAMQRSGLPATYGMSAWDNRGS